MDDKAKPNGKREMVDSLRPIAAGQPDILMAALTDEHYANQMASLVSDALRALVSARQRARFEHITKSVGHFLYLILTFGRGSQTLGEEYCDLFPIVETSSLPLPVSWMRRVLFSIFASFGGIGHRWFIRYLLKKFATNEESNAWFVDILRRWDRILPQIISFHLAIFFFYGIYYQFGRRLFSLKYIFARKPDQPSASYRALGFFMFIQLSVSSLASIFRFLRAKRLEQASQKAALEAEMSDDSETNIQCNLCLENRKFSTATPCGHVFCWECIHRALQDKSECPLCRQPADCPSLIRLFHYG